MRTIGTAVLAVLAVVSGCGGGGGGGSDGAVSSGSEGTAPRDGSVTESYSNGHPVVLSTTDDAVLALETETERLVNDRRVAIGKNALVSTASIRNVARAHSDHMILHDFFAHTNPEGDSPGVRLTRGGVSWTMAGENLAAGYSTPQAAYDAWMNSPGHKENIERDGWVYTGVGYWYEAGSRYGWYWTQNFTKP
ncbi:MAG: hypothetical protein HYY17_05685 [Planctomycetes bacterium]|nr:hypothetical protein [Planctomycetota bacterium]